MKTMLEKIERIRAMKPAGENRGAHGVRLPDGALLDESGIDIILVGDSLGMVVLGFPDTTSVTMEHMVHHYAAVGRGVKRALVVADLPIGSCARAPRRRSPTAAGSSRRAPAR
jgi:3-methyl-2-oxobutanoate hydroxymethyltransferase